MKNPTQQSSKFISMPDVTLNLMTLKPICFLYSISIELFLKGLYSATKTTADPEKTESFGHQVVRLTQKLVAKETLKRDELDKETLELAQVILEWSGRYYMPQPGKIDRAIESFFEEAPDNPAMLKPKFSINFETAAKLQSLAK